MLVELTIVLAILTELVSDWLDSIPLLVPTPFDPLVIPSLITCDYLTLVIPNHYLLISPH